MLSLSIISCFLLCVSCFFRNASQCSLSLLYFLLCVSFCLYVNNVCVLTFEFFLISLFVSIVLSVILWFIVCLLYFWFLFVLFCLVSFCCFLLFFVFERSWWLSCRVKLLHATLPHKQAWKQKNETKKTNWRAKIAYKHREFFQLTEKKILFIRWRNEFRFRDFEYSAACVRARCVESLTGSNLSEWAVFLFSSSVICICEMQRFFCLNIPFVCFENF